MDFESTDKKKIGDTWYDDERKLVAYLLMQHSSEGVTKKILVRMEQWETYPYWTRDMGTIPAGIERHYREAFQTLRKLKKEGRASGSAKKEGEILVSFDEHYWILFGLRVERESNVEWLLKTAEDA